MAIATTIETDSGRAKRNVAVLFLAHAILGSQMPMHIILGGLAGAYLSPDPALATLPISAVVVASMCTAAPASLYMGRVGRRIGFLTGAAAATVGAFLCMQALLIGSFALLVVGAAVVGVYQSFQQYFRFAAADTASHAFKPKAISWVLAGGLVAALLGPEILTHTRDHFAPIPFAGAYGAMLAINLVGAVVLLFLDIPTPPKRAKGSAAGRSLREILGQPRVIVAMMCGMIAFALMSLVMTSTPLAMVGCGYSPDDAADVVRWHAFAMFAPSFFTGNIIARFGQLPVMAVGLALLASCGVVALTGIDLTQFYVALILLGLGWNFAFIGATSLLASSHTPEEQAKVQGLNDFLVFGLVSIASFSSGALLNAYGWQAVQYAMGPALLVAGAAIAWLSLHRRRQRA
ncbi:MAG: MFS transporter [Alphaproteobacteria bacterium]